MDGVPILMRVVHVLQVKLTDSPLACEGVREIFIPIPPDRAPTDLINTRILQNMISGIPLILDLGTRM